MAASEVRDLATLNKIELLSFDDWGVMNEISTRREVSDENAALIDQIAEVTLRMRASSYPVLGPFIGVFPG